MNTINQLPTVQNTLSCPPDSQNKWVRKILLIATLAFGILAMIPPFRLTGILAVRSIGILAGLARVRKSMTNKSLGEKVWCTLLNTARVGVLTLGLAAIITATPLFLIISLGIDIGVQILEIGTALAQKRMWAAFIHLAILIVDALFLAALVTNAPQAMIAAMCVGAFSMLVLAVYASHKNMPLESLCFIALAGLGIANAAVIGKTIETFGITSFHHPLYTNHNDFPVAVYGNGMNYPGDPIDYSHPLAILEPGDSYSMSGWNFVHAVCPATSAFPLLFDPASVSASFIGADSDQAEGRKKLSETPKS